MDEVHTFIISLEDVDSNKNKLLIEKLTILGHKVKLENAKNGKQLLACDYFEKMSICKKRTGKAITPSELGCTLSHLSIYKKIIESNIKYALILEDDVIINALDLDVIKTLIDKTSKPDFFIHLGGQDGFEHLSNNAHGSTISNNPIAWRIFNHDVDKFVRTVGYVISLETAKQLTSLISTTFPIIDNFQFLYNNNGFSEFIFSKIINHPIDLMKSSIQPERSLLESSPVNIKQGLANRIFNEIAKSMNFRLFKIKYYIKTRNLPRINE